MAFVAYPLTGCLFLSNSNCSSISMLPESRWRISIFFAIRYQNRDNPPPLPKAFRSKCREALLCSCSFWLGHVHLFWNADACGGQLTYGIWNLFCAYGLLRKCCLRLLANGLSHRLRFPQTLQFDPLIHILCKADIRCSSDASCCFEYLDTDTLALSSGH